MKGLLGYIEFYFKATTNAGIAYARIAFDFRKPVTKRTMKYLLRKTKEIYEEAGKQVTKVEFCTKKEYESDESECLINHVWSEE